MGRVLFVTGTDTGVGKTFLTCLLLRHLRDGGVNALAVKPFCTGDLLDAKLLREHQDGALKLAEITPFFYPWPVAPLVAARRKRQIIQLEQVMAHVEAIRQRCEVLLVEGCGGLLVPLGERFSVLDLIAGLRCGVVMVAPNRLGTVNHTLLSLRAMESRGLKSPTLVLMGARKPDPSQKDNAKIIAEFGSPVRVIPLPFLGGNVFAKRSIAKSCKKLQKPLAEIVAEGILAARSANN